MSKDKLRDKKVLYMTFNAVMTGKNAILDRLTAVDLYTQ